MFGFLSSAGGDAALHIWIQTAQVKQALNLAANSVYFSGDNVRFDTLFLNLLMVHESFEIFMFKWILLIRVRVTTTT